jgi:hypothetical protein
VLTFRQACWMKPYIDFNTERRKLANNEFEKDFFKLMSNSTFGKTMENLRNHVNMRFITSNAEMSQKFKSVRPQTIDRTLASPLYNGHIIYDSDLAAVKMKKKVLVLNKPIYAGMAILDLSKLHMFGFHYDVIKAQYGSKAQLLFTDTDSLCYRIETEDFYQDMHESKQHYDFSGFDKNSPFYDDTNKKVLGKFKDECDGKAPSEFIGLRPKMYSLKIGEKEKKTGKGIHRGFLKKHVSHADYVRCLTSEIREDQQQHAKFNTIRSAKHVLGALTINKVGLCCYDNKRYLLDPVSSLSYGHYRIGECEPEPEPEC